MYYLLLVTWSHFKACLAVQGRVVTALGKHWCVEHFVCAKCEKPFLGNRHYERKGLAYCETHYHQLFGNLCYISNQVSGIQFLWSLMFTRFREGASRIIGSGGNI